MTERTMKKKMAKRKRQKMKVIGLAVMLVLIIVLSVVAFAMSKWGKMDRIKLGKDDIETNELSKETIKNMEGYTTLALFGLDNRSNGNFERGNSDTIIIASISNKTGEIKMLSVYRDTYLDLTDGTFNKANSAYNKGGPKQAVNMLNKNLDLHITDYVSVDFNALVDVIDMLGGIELEITEEEAVYINGYIDEIVSVTGKSSNHISAGTQLVDGTQATAYARIRYTTGWDYKRTERQRIVLGKIFEKVKQADLGTLNDMLDAVLPEVSTSLSLSEMMGMMKNVGKYNMGENAGFPFEKESADVGNVSYAVVAVDFLNNVKQLHEFLFDGENYTPSANVQQLSETMRNQTGY